MPKPKNQTKKRGPRPNRGPFSYSDLVSAFESDGWKMEAGGKHPQMRHPTKRGKISLSPSWTGVKVGSTVWRSMCRQAGMTSTELIALLNPGLERD